MKNRRSIINLLLVLVVAVVVVVVILDDTLHQQQQQSQEHTAGAVGTSRTISTTTSNIRRRKTAFFLQVEAFTQSWTIQKNTRRNVSRFQTVQVMQQQQQGQSFDNKLFANKNDYENGEESKRQVPSSRTDDDNDNDNNDSLNNNNNINNMLEQQQQQQQQKQISNNDKGNNNNSNAPFLFTNTGNPVLNRIKDVQLLLFDVFLLLNLTLSASFWVVYRLDVIKTMTIALNEGCILSLCWIISGIINNSFGGDDEDVNEEDSNPEVCYGTTTKDPLVTKAISTFVMASVIRLGLALVAYCISSTSDQTIVLLGTETDGLMATVSQATQSPASTFMLNPESTTSSIIGLKDNQAAKLVPLELGVGGILMTTWRMLHGQITKQRF